MSTFARTLLAALLLSLAPSTLLARGSSHPHVGGHSHIGGGSRSYGGGGHSHGGSSVRGHALLVW